MRRRKATEKNSKDCPPRKVPFRAGKEDQYLNILDGFSPITRKEFSERYDFNTNKIKGGVRAGKELGDPAYSLLSNDELLYYNSADVCLLIYNREDYTPNFYLPILPVVLLNNGLGVHCHPTDVLRKVKMKILEQSPIPLLVPCYNDITDSAYIFTENEIVIDESRNENKRKATFYEFPKSGIRINSNYDDNSKSKIIHKCFSSGNPNGMKELCRKNLGNNRTTSKLHFKLFNPITKEVMQFENLEEIFEEYFKLRLQFYEEKKVYCIGLAEAKIEKINEFLKFGKLNLWTKAKGNTCTEKLKSLMNLGCRPDPIRCFKKNFCLSKGSRYIQTDNILGPLASDLFWDFEYLLNNPVSAYLEEEMAKKEAHRDLLIKSLESAKTTTPQNIWIQELEKIELRFWEQQENERLENFDLTFEQALRGFENL